MKKILLIGITIIGIFCAYNWLKSTDAISPSFMIGTNGPHADLPSAIKPKNETARPEAPLVRVEPSGVSAAQESRLREIVRGSHFALTQHGSTTLTSSAISLLEMQPEQVEALNKALAVAMEKVKAAELKVAYVEKAPNGDEVIVVPPRDFGDLRESFKTLGVSLLGEAKGNVLADLFYRDDQFSLLEEPMKLTVETNANGKPDIVIERAFLNPKAANRYDVISRNGISYSPVSRVSSVFSAMGNSNDRFIHLWNAVDSMPRKESN